MTPQLFKALLISVVVTVLVQIVRSQDVFQSIAADDEKSLVKLLNVYNPNIAGIQNPDSLIINRRGPGLQTPLMFAVLNGKTSIVKLLLDRGARTDIAEKDGYTPMHGAGFQGRADIAKLLIEHGVDPSLRHKDGYTPLHRACWGSELRHADTVAVLLEVGKVSIEEAANDGRTCMDMTTNEDTKRVLQAWAASKDRAL